MGLDGLSLYEWGMNGSKPPALTARHLVCVVCALEQGAGIIGGALTALRWLATGSGLAFTETATSQQIARADVKKEEKSAKKTGRKEQEERREERGIKNKRTDDG